MYYTSNANNCIVIVYLTKHGLGFMDMHIQAVLVRTTSHGHGWCCMNCTSNTGVVGGLLLPTHVEAGHTCLPACGPNEHSYRIP